VADRRKGGSLFNPERRRGGDRRGSPRYRVADLAVRVTWESEGRRVEARGVLCDVGTGGVCLLLREPPPRGVKVEVRLEGRPAVSPVAGCVAHVRKTRRLFRGPLLVGPRLAEPCPYDFFFFSASVARG
jgi:hypothetical protein